MHLWNTEALAHGGTVCRYADKAVQVDPLELQGMPAYPQIFPATGGSGTYLAESCSPISPLERMQTEDGSDVSPRLPNLGLTSKSSIPGQASKLSPAAYTDPP